MARRVKVDDFGKALQEILDDYEKSVSQKTNEAIKKAAEVAKQEVKAAAPVHNGAYVGERANRKPGRYRKGWAVKEDSGSRLRFEYVVHNRTDYQLTHLLENGHALKRGGRTYGQVGPFTHIAPAEEHAIDNIRKAVEKIAQDG